MTYLQFLLLFLFPPILTLAIRLRRHALSSLALPLVWRWLLAVALIAFVYTTPWDNYLVYRGVWMYGSERVLGTIGYVPIEEYIFFLLQSIFTGLTLVLFLNARLRGESSSSVPTWWRPVLVTLWLSMSIIGIYALIISTQHPSLTYIGLILSWSGPVLLGMTLLAARVFWEERRAWVQAVAWPTLYLWVADRIAIGLGIWDISDTYSLGLEILGLPLEEAAFFLLTNILVVQGLLMFLPVSVGRDTKKIAITAQSQ